MKSCVRITSFTTVKHCYCLIAVTDIFYEKICGVQVKLNYEKRGIKMKPEKATKSKPAAAPVGYVHLAHLS